MFRKLSLIVFFFLVAAPSFAQESAHRTVIVRDGDVLLDDGAPGGKRAYLGISLTQITPELREFFGAPKDAGVLVSSVAADSPAAKAGVRVGDVITAINGNPAENYGDLIRAMKDKHAGDSIRLDVIRGKSRQSIVATAEEREMPEIRRAFALDKLGRELDMPLMGPEWRARVATPDTEELRARIRDLETRLQELEKKLQQK